MSVKKACPCKRLQCERHGDCEACKAHHHAGHGYPLTTCERMEKRRQAKRIRHNP